MRVLEEARGVAAAERSRERLACFDAYMAALYGATSEAGIFKALLEQGSEALGAPRALVALVDGGDLVFGAAKGISSKIVGPGRRDPICAATLMTDAAREGAALFIETEAEWEQRYSPKAARACGPAGARVALPMIAAGRVLGVVGFFYPQATHFSVEERAFAQMIARHAASALERARGVERASALAEAEISRACEMASAASRRKDEFLALLGHELRNPLSPILTALYLMRIKGAEGTERERQVIERQVQHLVSLVDDLLDVSRVMRGKIKLATEPLEVGAVIAKAIEMASPLLEQKRHSLSVDVPPAGLLIDADEKRLAQVFANLLTNAAKYTDEGGQVRVFARRQGAEVVVVVRDNGMGISPELLPVIFELFVQGERGADRAGGGLGLGLGLVKSLVALHGGAVAARSEGRGRGSEFEVRLRACEITAREGAPRAASPMVFPICMRRVLVVDDNADAARLLGDVLRAQGHEVRIAYDGPQALAIAGDFRPEVGILDIGLPVMDGYELALELRRRLGQGIDLVAVTGYGQESDKQRAFAAGFSRHYVKPVEAMTLAQEVFSSKLASGSDRS